MCCGSLTIEIAMLLRSFIIIITFSIFVFSRHQKIFMVVYKTLCIARITGRTVLNYVKSRVYDLKLQPTTRFKCLETQTSFRCSQVTLGQGVAPDRLAVITSLDNWQWYQYMKQWIFAAVFSRPIFNKKSGSNY